MRRNAVVLFVLFLALGVTGFAQQKSPEAGARKTDFYPLEDIRPGQKGVARTVFSGSEPQEFGVEVLGVLPGFPAPRQSVIIARLSGAQVDRTSVFAGMSGSPVYIDGRRVGAVAYAFPFEKEPIAGITPIKQMFDMFERGGRASGGRDQLGFLREPHAVSYSQLSGTDWKPQLPTGQTNGAAFVAPVATGSPLAALLGLGSSDMPMAESTVVTVIPNTMNSFKLTVPGQMVGTISQDRSTGIYGQLGQAPKMIPVTINLHTSRDQVETYKYEVASDEFLTPLLLNMTVYSTITSSERSLGDSTVSVRGTIAVKGQEPITLERRFSTTGAGVNAAGAVAAPVQALLSSGFEGVELGPITLDIASVDTRRAATLDRISLDRGEVRSGETIEVQAYVRTESGKQFVQRIPVEIPADVPPGQLVLFVGDGGTVQQASASQSFVPKDLGQLVGAINKLKKNDRLYVKLFRVTNGAVIGTDEMPNLPPSFVATLNSDRATGGFTPTQLSPVGEKELPPAEYVISGQQLIGINVIR